jgi:molybdate transport system ATP-binding protein
MTAPDAPIRVALRGALGGFALDAAFSVPARGVTALFGPSGCGKTSVLRGIAGLLRVRDGLVDVAGDVWQDATLFLPPHRRPLGYVFQEASLFPPLSVEQNLLYGARRAAPPAGRPAIARGEVIELLGLARLLDRAPHHLSGGERQRVAIGRALLAQPALLLMDEPLSALDRPTREEILPFLERLHERLALPVLYVSHDIGEVERLADTLVLMEAGRVLAAGPLASLQADPALPLARSRDAAVSLAAVTAGHDARYGLLALDVAGGRFLVPAAPAAAGLPKRLRIMAGDVSLATAAPEGSTILNALPARILSAEPLGAAELTVLLALGAEGGGARILARVTRRSWELLGLAPGSAVIAQVKGVSLLASGPGHARPAN